MNKGKEPQPYPFMDRGGVGNRIETALGTINGRRKELVVDVNALSCARTARLLENRGFEVRTAANYSDALVVVKVWMPDVIYAGIKQGSGEFLDQVRPYYEDPEPVRDLRWQVDSL